MEYDLKLLQDICPYTFAYGHTLSNYVHNYKYGVACFRLTGNETDRIIAEYFERVLRSFLITKNLSYSAKLIDKAMELQYNKDLSFSKIDYDKIKEDWGTLTEWYKEQEKQHIINKTKKQFIDILTEWYKINYPDSNINDILFKISKELDSSYISSIKFSDNLSLKFLIYAMYSRYEDDYDSFDVAIYRSGNKPIRCKLNEAIGNFPELLNNDNEWKENI